MCPYSYQNLSAFPAANFATSYINKASIYGTFGVKLCLGQTATQVMEFHSSANSLSEAENATPIDELSAGKPSHSGIDTEIPFDHVVRMMSRHSTFDGPQSRHQGEDGDD